MTPQKGSGTTEGGLRGQKGKEDEKREAERQAEAG